MVLQGAVLQSHTNLQYSTYIQNCQSSGARDSRVSEYQREGQSGDHASVYSECQEYRGRERMRDGNERLGKGGKDNSSLSWMGFIL